MVTESQEYYEVQTVLSEKKRKERKKWEKRKEMGPEMTSVARSIDREFNLLNHLIASCVTSANAIHKVNKS